MVLFGENDYMATVPEQRSRSLHNFSLPKWGIQRHMKCTKGEFNSDGSGVTSEHHQQHQAESPPFEIANSSLVIRLRLREANQSSHRLQKSPSKSAEKLEVQEKEKPNRFKISARKENQCEEIVMEERRVSKRKRKRSEIAKTEEEIKEIVPEKRTKSMISKDAMEDDVEDQEKEKPNRIRAMKENQSNELRTEERTVTRKRGRSVTAKSEKKESVKLVVPLSKKEIEEDYMQMLGHRPPRRPTKRPRTVQKELENLFPAFSLTEVTLDMYKVEENPQRS